jgi:hypothetical protein
MASHVDPYVLLPSQTKIFYIRLVLVPDGLTTGVL